VLGAKLTGDLAYPDEHLPNSSDASQQRTDPMTAILSSSSAVLTEYPDNLSTQMSPTTVITFKILDIATESRFPL
jgi:hypothetical protein